MTVAAAARPAVDLYGEALRDAVAARGARHRATTAAGEPVPFDVGRWIGATTAIDDRALAGLPGPVLDVGCGPGRHLLALLGAGVPAVGIDIAPAAVALARRRGARAVRACVFGPVPGAGRFGAALLLDGNVGIGGDPAALLRRVRELLVPAGTVLAELEAPGAGLRCASVRLRGPGGEASAPFPWARVGADAIGPAAATAGLAVSACWEDGGRWFARLASLPSDPCPRPPTTSSCTACG